MVLKQEQCAPWGCGATLTLTGTLILNLASALQKCKSNPNIIPVAAVNKDSVEQLAVDFFLFFSKRKLQGWDSRGM